MIIGFLYGSRRLPSDFAFISAVSHVSRSKLFRRAPLPAPSSRRGTPITAAHAWPRISDTKAADFYDAKY